MHLFHLFPPSPGSSPFLNKLPFQTCITSCLPHYSSLKPRGNSSLWLRNSLALIIRSSSQSDVATCFSFLQRVACYNCIALQFCIFLANEGRGFCVPALSGCLGLCVCVRWNYIHALWSGLPLNQNIVHAFLWPFQRPRWMACRCTAAPRWELTNKKKVFKRHVYSKLDIYDRYSIYWGFLLLHIHTVIIFLTLLNLAGS